MCLTLALISAFYYNKIQVSFSSLYFFDMQSCLTGIEKVKKSEKNQNHVRVMYLYGMCLVIQKKRVVSYKPVCIQACLA